MMIQIEQLTEKKIKEAVDFMKWVCELTYEEFEERKKENSWWSELLLNWCRIRHQYPELNEIWETKFISTAREDKHNKNKSKILAEMSRNKQNLVKEHLLGEMEAQRMTYRIIRKEFIAWDRCVTLAIPYDAPGLLANKFGATIQFSRKQCPELFDEVCDKYKQYDWSTEFTSNSDKYSKRF